MKDVLLQLVMNNIGQKSYPMYHEISNCVSFILYSLISVLDQMFVPSRQYSTSNPCQYHSHQFVLTFDMLFLSFHFLSDCMMLMLMRLNDGCLLCTSILHPWVLYFFLLQMYKDKHTFYVMKIFLVKKETELICSHHLSL